MSARDRPVHLRWRSVLLVFVGGTVGTTARYGVGQAIPRLHGVPVATASVNLLGAFLLGLLLERLGRGGPDVGWRRDLRLLAGTGFLGGFTTYSALATDTAGLAGSGRASAAVLYAAGTLLLGAAAAAFGLWCGGRGRAGDPAVP